MSRHKQENLLKQVQDNIREVWICAPLVWNGGDSPLGVLIEVYQVLITKDVENLWFDAVELWLQSILIRQIDVCRITDRCTNNERRLQSRPYRKM